MSITFNPPAGKKWYVRYRLPGTLYSNQVNEATGIPGNAGVYEQVEVDHGAPFELPEGATIVELKDAGDNTTVDDRLWNTNGGGDGGQ